MVYVEVLLDYHPDIKFFFCLFSSFFPHLLTQVGILYEEFKFLCQLFCIARLDKESVHSVIYCIFASDGVACDNWTTY